MKRFLAFLALCWAAFTADGATRTLLILEDQTAVGLCGKVYRDWTHQIVHEGWTVTRVPITRWDRNWASNDWVSLNRMSNAVTWAQPDAVLIFGCLPYLQTAGHAADGHLSRRIHTDAWLGCTNLVFTDDDDWGLTDTSSVIGTNRPNDGFPDEFFGNFSVPVSRIDASGLTAIGGAGSTFAAGYLAGTQIYQATDEGDALRRYTTSNVAYRRKVFAFAEAGRLEVAMWANAATVTAANTAVSWTTGAAANSFAGLTNRWSYVGTEWGQASPNYITAEGVAKLSFGHVVYKSYHMDDHPASGQFLRRPLFPGWWPRPLAFMSFWGYGVVSQDPYWTGTAADQTAADMIRTSVRRSSGGGVLCRWDRHWVHGDLTLPCDPITARPVGSTSATTLRVIAP